MTNPVSVTLSGPALSFLIYENTRSVCDQEGFLLGEVVNHVTCKISDSHMNSEEMETLISINSLVPLPSTIPFYNEVGRVNRDRIKSFVGELEKEVVGWYTFRRNAALVPHMRDKALHKELHSLLPHISSEHFMMCLLNTVVSNTGSTHSFNHKFVRYRFRNYETLPLQIYNLGEAQPEYITVPSAACLSDSFTDIVKTVKESAEGDAVDSVMCLIQKSLQDHLRKLTEDLVASEKCASLLEKEVELLRNHHGSLSNEILLPQLLRDDENKTENFVAVEVPASPVISKTSKIQPSMKDKCQKESNVCDSGPEEPFAYVTEMKLEMSQAPGLTDAGIKRVNDRGRASRRGSTTRELRNRRGQSKVDHGDNNLELNAVTRRTGQPQSNSAVAMSPVSKSPVPSNSLAKQRGCATVTKKVVDGSKCTKSAVSSANGSPTYSNSQEY